MLKAAGCRCGRINVFRPEKELVCCIDLYCYSIVLEYGKITNFHDYSRLGERTQQILHDQESGICITAVQRLRLLN